MEKQRTDVQLRHPDAVALYQKVNAEEERRVLKEECEKFLTLALVRNAFSYQF